MKRRFKGGRTLRKLKRKFSEKERGKEEMKNRGR
jgi:hypothetical protein